MKAEKRNKRKGRRKGGLLRCFGAPAVADEPVDDDNEEEEEEREGEATGSSGSLPAASAGWTSSCSSRSLLPGEEAKARRREGAGKRKRFPKRMLATIVRSAVFVASLQQKARSDVVRRDSKQAPPMEASAGWEDGDPNSDAGFSSSSLSSSSFPSSSSSTVTSSSQAPVASTGKGQEAKTAPSPTLGESSDVGGGLCLVVLVVLFVLVFWGRLCAIIWTSACLCFVPGRGCSEALAKQEAPRRRLGPPGGARCRMLVAVKAWEKRRVVLEGLLDRSRKP